MSLVTAWNAAIAVIEDRPKDARHMLRTETLTVDIGSLYSRLMSAVDKVSDKEVATCLRTLLRATLTLDPVVPPAGLDKAAYYQGVRDVEEQIEAMLKDFEQEQQ